MEELSDEVLVDSYKKALYLKLNKDFIFLLKIELLKRNLLFQMEDTDEYSS